MRLDRLTAQAREILELAQKIVRGPQQAQLDVEHLTLALLRQKGGAAPRMLRHLGLDVTALDHAVERGLEQLPAIHTPYYAYQQIYVYATPRTQRLAKRADQLAGVVLTGGRGGSRTAPTRNPYSTNRYLNVIAPNP